MDSQQCRYILALAEYKNFSKAAAAVFVSQPYLSKLVATVERELGVTLFDRSHKQMVITSAGESYLTYMREILHAEQKMKAQVGEISAHRAGSLRVGIPPTHGSYILPDILKKFRALYPGIQVTVEEQNNKKLIESLLDGLIDLCCLSLPDYPQEVATEVIAREYILLVMPPEHPLGQHWAKGNCKKPVPFPEEHVLKLGKERFIILTEAQGIGMFTRMMFSDLGINPDIFMETRNIETAYRLAVSGAGLTFIPEICTRFSSFQEEPYYYSLGNPPYIRNISIAFLKKRRLSQAERDFIEVARDSV